MQDCKVIELINSLDYGKGIKVELTGDTPLKGYGLIMAGFDVSVSAGDELKAEDVVGTTTKDNMVLILIDLEKAYVENIEDWVKVPMKNNSTQAYQAWEGDLEMLADAIHHESCGGSWEGPDDEKIYMATSMGFTIVNKLNSDSGFKPDYNIPSNLWAPDKSPLYNLLCRLPGAQRGWYAIAAGLRQRLSSGTLKYCKYCYEGAVYCLENDSLTLLNMGICGNQFEKGEPMPHTVWSQGSTGSETGKRWVQRDNITDTVDKGYNKSIYRGK